MGSQAARIPVSMGLAELRSSRAPCCQQPAIQNPCVCGLFLQAFFTLFALVLIGVKDQRDQRDGWHHGGWMLKLCLWGLLILLAFLAPTGLVGAYGETAHQSLRTAYLLAAVWNPWGGKELSERWATIGDSLFKAIVSVLMWL